MAGRKKNGEKFTQLHVTVTPRIMEQIDQLAQAFAQSQAAVVRQAIARWHRDEFPPQQPQPSETGD